MLDIFIKNFKEIMNYGHPNITKTKPKKPFPLY